MIARAHIFEKLLAIVLPLAAAAPLAAAPAAPSPAKPEMPRSVFVYPSKPQEGRDPFFPNSTRPYDQSPNRVISGPSLTDLTLKGITGGGFPLAIINNRTFAAGDVGPVVVKNGQRLIIHCVSINIESNSVTVEANGVSQELTFPKNPSTNP